MPKGSRQVNKVNRMIPFTCNSASSELNKKVKDSKIPTVQPSCNSTRRSEIPVLTQEDRNLKPVASSDFHSMNAENKIEYLMDQLKQQQLLIETLIGSKAVKAKSLMTNSAMPYKLKAD